MPPSWLPPLPPPLPLSLDAQLACIQRELDLRRQLYPRLIARGRISRQTADHELAQMQAVAETLALLGSGRVEEAIARAILARYQTSSDLAQQRMMEQIVEEHAALAVAVLVELLEGQGQGARIDGEGATIEGAPAK